MEIGTEDVAKYHCSSHKQNVSGKRGKYRALIGITQQSTQPEKLHVHGRKRGK
jgi:hypothetical protein